MPEGDRPRANAGGWINDRDDYQRRAGKLHSLQIQGLPEARRAAGHGERLRGNAHRVAGRSQLKAIDTVIARYASDQVARNISLTSASLKRGPQYILDGTLENEAVALHFDGLKRKEEESKLGDFHYLPVRFHEGRQVKEQKLLLEVYGVMFGLQGRAPARGVVLARPGVQGDEGKLNPDHREAEQMLRRGSKDMATSGLQPRLLLNDHCPVCEFRQRCRGQAVQEDNITLLRGMGEKEVNRYARKGISTVTQLSCTFRLRKRGKRVKTQQRPHYFSLRAAMAIREKKCTSLGRPRSR